MTTIVEPLLDIESASIVRSINYDVTINRAEHKLVRYTHLAALIWGAFPFIIYASHNWLSEMLFIPID